MAGTIIAYESCPNCQADQLFGELNCRTGERTYRCLACGNYEKLQFHWRDGEPSYKMVTIPLEQVALTVRINNSKSRTLPVVWDSEVPEQADTDFIYLFLNQKEKEINERYPGFLFPDLAAIGQQFDAYAFCAVEKRLPHPSRRDTLPYIRMSYPANKFEIRTNNDRRELVASKRKYTAKLKVGGGVISIMNDQGNPGFWLPLPPGTTVRRAQRLWAAHINEHTDYQNSYMTLMQDGKLQVLKGTLPVSEDSDY